MVSVIIPNYNHGHFLKKRIDTVLEQTYQDFEVIILDDCSTDNSKKIIEEYRGHPKVSQIIYNETNSGSTFKQWRKGLHLSKGSLIWIAESDDYTANTFLEKAIDAHFRYPSVGIVYTNSHVINEEGKLLYQEFYEQIPKRYKRDFFNNGIAECRDYFTLENPISNASSVVFKARFLNEIDFNSIKLRMSGDWLIYVSILFQSDIYFIAERLNFYRTHSDNVRSRMNAAKKVYETLSILEFLVQKKIIDKESFNLRAAKIQKDARHAVNYSLTSGSMKKIITSCSYFQRTKNKVKSIRRSFEKLAQRPLFSK